MRITMVYRGLGVVRKWALQDSNLRPSDYESVRAPSENSTQHRFRSGARGQIATNCDTFGQSAATLGATRPADIYARPWLAFTAWKVLA